MSFKKILKAIYKLWALLRPCSRKILVDMFCLSFNLLNEPLTPHADTALSSEKASVLVSISACCHPISIVADSRSPGAWIKYELVCVFPSGRAVHVGFTQADSVAACWIWTNNQSAIISELHMEPCHWGSFINVLKYICPPVVPYISCFWLHR